MNAPRITSRPEPGLFKLRLVKGGPWVSASIRRVCHCTINGGLRNVAHDWRDTCDRYPPLSAEIGGSEADVFRVWETGRLIDQDEYRYITSTREWAESYAPGAPEANPRRAVDLHAMPPLF